VSIIKKQLGNFLSWFVVFLWMILIFKLSSQPAEVSNQLSKEITQIIVKTVEKVVPKTELDSFNHILRKNAVYDNLKLPQYNN